MIDDSPMGVAIGETVEHLGANTQQHTQITNNNDVQPDTNHRFGTILSQLSSAGITRSVSQGPIRHEFAK